MINFRPTDYPKIYLSGGWENIANDPEFLFSQNIKAVLDLQYTVNDAASLPMTVRDALSEWDIEYTYYPFEDTENYSASALEESLSNMSLVLNEWEEKYPRRNQHILIKCGAGVSRSPTAYLYYMCNRYGGSYLSRLWELRWEEEGWTQFGSSPNVAFHSFLKKKFPDENYDE